MSLPSPQVDLAREASNLSRFNYNFRKTDHVRFPVPLFPLVSADVLVESFEEGDHITAYIEVSRRSCGLCGGDSDTMGKTSFMAMHIYIYTCMHACRPPLCSSHHSLYTLLRCRRVAIRTTTGCRSLAQEPCCR